VNFTFRGKSVEELKKLSHDEFALLVPSRQRRTLQRGLSEDHKKLLHKVKIKDPNIRDTFAGYDRPAGNDRYENSDP